MQIRGLDHESVDYLVAKFYASMLKSMRATMSTVSKSFSLVAAGAVSESEPGAVTAYDNLSMIQVAWATQVTEVLKPELLGIFSQAGVTVAKPIAEHFGHSETPIEHTVAQWNDGAIAHMWQAVNRVTAFSDELWSTAKHQLTLGMQDGEGIAELAERVEAVTGVKEKKAHVIAQTEVIAAVNGGEWTQMRASAAAFDLVMTKEWHATEDSHTRPTHATADGQVVPLDEKFVVGDAFLDFPGDPTGQPAEIISCRCTMLYEFDETPQIEPSETSSDAQTASAPAATTSAYRPLEDGVLTAAFNEAEHPRGKNGKFIKKGVDLPGTVFELLSIAKKIGKGNDVGDSFTDTEKKNFAGVVANQLTQSQWNNLKDDDKDIIHKIVENALDTGAPNSANASLHLEELDANDDGGPELDDAPDVFDPNTPLSDLDAKIPLVGDKDLQYLPKSMAGGHENAVSNPFFDHSKTQADYKAQLGADIGPGVKHPMFLSATFANTLPSEKVDAASLIHTQSWIRPINPDGSVSTLDPAGPVIAYHDAKGDLYLVNGHHRVLQAMASGKSQIYVRIYDKEHAFPANAYTLADLNKPDAVKQTTIAKATPIKMTHGLIHAKHTPGEVIAQTKTGGTGVDVRVKWNGSAYEVQPKSAMSGWQTADIVKKSQLYAYLAQNFPNAQWVKPGKQDITVDAPSTPSTPSTGEPSIVGPHAKKLPTNKLFPDEDKDDLDELFGPLNKGLAPTPAELKKTTVTNEDISSVVNDMMNEDWKSAQLGIDAIKEKQEGPLAKAIAQGGIQKYKEIKGTASQALLDKKISNTDYLNIEDSLKSGDLDHAAAVLETLLKNTPSEALAPSSVTPSASPLTPSNVALKLDMTGWKQVAGNQGGFNQGGVFEAPNGERYYVKSLANQNALRSEVLAAHLYEAAGVKVPEVHFVNPFGTPTGWSNVVASKIVDGKNAKQKMLTDADFNAKIQDGFAVDAWLSNWDAVGSGDVKYSNILDVNGEPVRIDVGGSLEVGGTGVKKTGKFDPDQVVELSTFFNGTNKELQNVFSGMTQQQRVDSAKKHLQPMTDEKIDQLVKNAGMSTSMATTLKKRRDIILKFYGLDTLSSAKTAVDVTPSVDTNAYGVPKASTVTPPVPTSTSTPMTGVDHLTLSQKGSFYANFKSQKVSPAWSGAKIWNSLHAAQAQDAGDPSIAQLTPEQMLQIVDQFHSKSGTPYANKVKEWLKTPNGKKAALLAKSTGAPAVSASPIKKAATATAPSVLPKVTAADLLGEPSIEPIGPITKQQIFSAFKNKTKGSYLKGEPKDILTQAKLVADQQNVSPLQVLKIIDEKTAQNYGTENNHLFEKKVLTWAESHATVDDLTKIAKKAPAKKASIKKAGVSTSATSTPPGSKHVAPVDLPGTSFKPYDPNEDSSKYQVIGTSKAQSLWDLMQTESPNGHITASQKAGLKKYTSSAYESMNSYLRAPNAYASPATVNAVKNAQLGMRPSTEDLLLHRGNGWFAGWQSVQDAVANVGKTMHQKAFFSTSVGGLPGLGSNAEIRFEIEAPKGTPMAYVDGFSQNQGEREMLLAAGLRYQVVSATPTGKSYGPQVVVRLRVIAEDGA